LREKEALVAEEVERENKAKKAKLNWKIFIGRDLLLLKDEILIIPVIIRLKSIN
jgi:hypothetical protein